MTQMEFNEFKMFEWGGSVVGDLLRVALSGLVGTTAT